MKKFIPVIFAVVMALIFRIYIVSMFKVPNQSMAPTITTGDYILGTQIFGSPVEGGLIVFVKNTKTFIRRVLAVPGTEVEYRDGVVYLNGAACTYRQLEGIYDASFVQFEEVCNGKSRQILRASSSATKPAGLPATRVAAGEFLVAPDNRDQDAETLALEAVRSDQIVGKPLVVWMSYSSTQDFISKSSGVRWNRILTILR